jgi:competence protein ComEC
VVTAVLAGYIAANTWPNVSPAILATVALIFAFGSLGVAVKAPVGGLRQSRWVLPWGTGFLIAGTLLAWAWHETQVHAPAVDWETLPPREATLTLRVTRNFTPRPGNDSVGGLAMVIDAPEVFNELRDTPVEFRLRLKPKEGLPVRGTTVVVRGVLTYLPELVPTAGDAKSEDAARFRAFLHAQGAWFELSRGSLAGESAPPSASTQWLTRQHVRVEALLHHGPTGLEEKYGNIYTALLLGEPALLDADERAAFTVAGEIYLFAISGLHVAVLAGTLWWLLKKIPGLPHAAGEWVTLTAAWLYIEIAGGTPSARRAGIMLTFYLLAKWFGRARSPLAAVLAAGVATLFIDPLALKNSGFELSYTVVLGLILYAPLLRAALQRRVMPWRDVPPASLAPWQKCTRWLWARLLDMVVTTWTALVGSAPLTAEFFGVFSAHTLSLNLVFFPLTCAVLWSGAVAVLAGFCGFPPFTWLAWLANGAGLVVVGVMQKIAQFAPPWPWVFVHLRLEPPVAGSLAALAVFGVMLLAQPKNRVPRWWYYLLPVAVLAGLAVFTARAG